MSKLNELLKGIDVELKLLGDVSKIFSGGTPNTSKLEYYDGNIPWIRSGEVNFNVITSSARNITKEGLLGSSAKLIRKNSVVLAMTGATVGRSAVVEFETSSNQSVAAIETDENIIFYKYLYYFLENSYIEIKNAGQGALTSLNLAMIKKFKIPIPCPDDPKKSLEIQQEIVRVLDELTSLTNQLTTELETERQNRKKQFEFFREQLFNNKSDNESWKILEEIIIKTYSGSTPRAGDVQYYNNGTIPWLRTQEVRFCEILDTEVKITELAVEKTGAKWIPINCVIIAISGATAGRSAINKIPLTTNQHCLCLEINSDKALYKYVYHWIKFNYENIKSLGRGARGDLNSSIIKNFKIPIPSLAEQERIVKLLDQFDATHTAIEEEITKEIKLRTQQYEYYREKLLSFPQN